MGNNLAPLPCDWTDLDPVHRGDYLLVGEVPDDGLVKAPQFQDGVLFAPPLQSVEDVAVDLGDNSI